MPHLEQLCEECVIETTFIGVNPLEHAKLGVRLITNLVMSTETVVKDYNDQQQKDAIRHCVAMNLTDSCPNIIAKRRSL